MIQPNVPASVPTPDIESIVDSARRVVTERPDFPANARRDVHAKHHGCVAALFEVDDQLDAAYQIGVFARSEMPFKAWIRFSNSSSTPQSDTIPDGRGVAIKLLAVPGERLIADAPQRDTQDFVLLNGPAFFARNAADMVIAARLQADDAFPSTFFASPGRLAGLAATVAMTSAQADSPLDLTYFSQTPYKLGSEWLVKYRLRPDEPVPKSSSKRATSNYLHEALRGRIQDQSGAGKDFVFRFEIQPRRIAEIPPDEIDDATQVWDGVKYPFITVARVIVPKQTLATKTRNDFAERLSFNPYNGTSQHEPQGSINQARLFVYKATASLRSTANSVNGPPPAYTEDEWKKLKDDETGAAWSPDEYPVPGVGAMLLNGFVHLFPGTGRLIEAFLSSPQGFVVAPILLVLVLAYGHCSPGGLVRPLMLPLGALLPSEGLIPPAMVNPSYSGKPFAENPVWTFRYSPVGAEANSGIPYWIFRALPLMFPARFDHREDWSKFGFDVSDDQDFYTDYHRLPRGLIVSDTVFSLGGNEVGVALKRVSLNCASCHRGEYLDDLGKPHFVDGMPSQRLDTAGFKMAAFDSFRDPGFTEDTVIGAVNALLAKEHARTPFLADKSPTPSALDWLEVEVYRQIVKVILAESATDRISWMRHRPLNGPGRLDAFGALRFEFLFPGSDVTDTTHISTVDLPSIWHQGDEWRPLHHWDGNTHDVMARSYGAVVGIGGDKLSIRRYEVQQINTWLEKNLPSPPYPFPSRKDLVDAGANVYNNSGCATCHGTYENGRLQGLPGGCMVQPTPIRTDPFRVNATNADGFIEKLNAFGAGAGLWYRQAFTPTTGYLCPPLDGVWARAPYLHNGSVPTLAFLLGPDKARPATFYRGSAEYLQKEGGFAWHESMSAGMPLFLFDTAAPGNSSSGHSAAPEGGGIPEVNGADQEALIAYLQTL
jgi:hypothetical protein